MSHNPSTTRRCAGRNVVESILAAGRKAGTKAWSTIFEFLTLDF
jgi:hypothetical protein